MRGDVLEFVVQRWLFPIASYLHESGDVDCWQETFALVFVFFIFLAGLFFVVVFLSSDSVWICFCLKKIVRMYNVFSLVKTVCG